MSTAGGMPIAVEEYSGPDAVTSHVRCGLQLDVQGRLGHRAGDRCRAFTMGAWVSTLASWTHFGTMTWADPTDTTTYTHHGVSYVERSWDKWAKRFGPTHAWAAMESHKYRPTPHMHSVFAGVDPAFFAESCTCDAAGRKHAPIWCETKKAFGRCKFEPVRSSLDAACYVAKYVNKGLGKLYTVGLGPDVPAPEARPEDWWNAVQNADLAEREREDAARLLQLHASNVALAGQQAPLRARTWTLLVVPPVASVVGQPPAPERESYCVPSQLNSASSRSRSSAR